MDREQLHVMLDQVLDQLHTDEYVGVFIAVSHKKEDGMFEFQNACQGFRSNDLAYVNQAVVMHARKIKVNESYRQYMLGIFDPDELDKLLSEKGNGMYSTATKGLTNSAREAFYNPKTELEKRAKPLIQKAWDEKMPAHEFYKAMQELDEKYKFEKSLNINNN